MENKKTKKTQKAQEEKPKTAEAVSQDRDCPFHGSLKTRGRAFEGMVTSKFNKRIAIEFERMVYVKKYERYSKSKTKIHARLPTCLEKEINIGDTVRVQECRPLSKIIHFVVVKKIKSKEEKK
ncbi:MAG: 30S ribosomal protein S17 [Nanoarchaeota archaeon]